MNFLAISRILDSETKNLFIMSNSSNSLFLHGFILFLSKEIKDWYIWKKKPRIILSQFSIDPSVMHEQKIAICPPKELLVLMLPSPISKAILNALEIEAKTIIYTAMYFIPFTVTCPTFDDWVHFHSSFLNYIMKTSAKSFA